MVQHTLALLIGGLVPAVLYGISNVAVKGAEKSGLGPALLMIITGLTVTAVGVIAFLFMPDKSISIKSAGYAVFFGIAWGVGSLCIAIAISRYNAPLSQLVPLYNTNTLIAVALSLVLFGEWKDVNMVTLLGGALLIVAGSVLVVRA